MFITLKDMLTYEDTLKVWDDIAKSVWSPTLLSIRVLCCHQHGASALHHPWPMKLLRDEKDGSRYVTLELFGSCQQFKLHNSFIFSPWVCLFRTSTLGGTNGYTHSPL